ncbi:hypothetical protein TcWFU_007399 [Taenia crassiceps]|uniref:Uncharacterized protein n=1 Tax=Taenia crassiceps TaxID=6207 RepID=A0ABR4QF90_9CEST
MGTSARPIVGMQRNQYNPSLPPHKRFQQNSPVLGCDLVVYRSTTSMILTHRVPAVRTQRGLLVYATAAMVFLIQTPACARHNALEEELALEDLPLSENIPDEDYFGVLPYRLDRRGFLHSGRLGRRGLLPSHQSSKRGFLTASRLG